MDIFDRLFLSINTVTRNSNGGTYTCSQSIMRANVLCKGNVQCMVCRKRSGAFNARATIMDTHETLLLVNNYCNWVFFWEMKIFMYVYIISLLTLQL